MVSAGPFHPQIEVDYDEETRATVKARQYSPTPNDLSNGEMYDNETAISVVWPEPPRPHHMHIFVRKPRGINPTFSGELFFFSPGT